MVVIYNLYSGDGCDDENGDDEKDDDENGDDSIYDKHHSQWN